jgi:hypothetical protein
MKKLIFSTTLVLFSFSLFLTAASADDYGNAYMVSGLGNTTQKFGDYVYGVDEPWFFVQFSNLTPANTSYPSTTTVAEWQWENTTPTWIKFYNSTENGVWGNLVDWGTDKQYGNWTINITTPTGSNFHPINYNKVLTFKVSNIVPEPASALLYILGGGSLIVGFLRKKKTKTSS